MSRDVCCSFCESLPSTARPGRGGSPSKCPLCKQGLWVSQAGATYRVDAASAVPARSGAMWCWALGLSAAVCVGVAVLLNQFAFNTGKEGKPQARLEPMSSATPSVLGERPRPAPPEAEKPSVQVKPGSGFQTARVKPLPTRVPEPKAVVKAVPDAYQYEPPMAKGSRGAIPADLGWTVFYNTEDLEAQLRAVPEADLDPDYRKKSKKQIAEKAKEILDETKKDQDTFIRKLMKDRHDLAGLPFLLGKDCALPKEEGANLARRSLEVRIALAESARRTSLPTRSARDRSESEPEAVSFWHDAAHRNAQRGWNKPEAVPALQQIVLVGNREFRLGFLKHVKDIKGAKATEGVVNRAIFDLDPEVRNEALKLLRDRPQDEYRAALTKALRYPWQPVVRHAADAVASLNLKGMIPELVAMLDEPEPGAPVAVRGEDGKVKVVVRELVRINHHRNCMLCHAPLDTTLLNRNEAASVPVGPVPSADEELPPASSPVYYSARRGSMVVRADITYLRQDFSLMQHVEKYGMWSHMQRFDFLVRTRELTLKDTDLRPREAIHSEYRQTISNALTVLTGKAALPTAKAWRDMLAMPEAKAGAAQ